MRKHLLMSLFVLAAAGLVVGVAASQSGAPANVIVRVPADAKVYFDDYLTSQTGESRSFNTPPLNPGVKYAYNIRAEVTRDGRLLSQASRVIVQGGQTSEVDFTNLQPQGQLPGEDVVEAGEDVPVGEPGWPRKAVVDDNTVTMFQPQLDVWEQNHLEARAAVSIETKASPQATFGVAWITARTDVDKEHRLVTLDDVQITRVNFPTAAEQGNDYLALVRKAFPVNGPIQVALDRLEANLAVTQAESKVQKQPLKNDPPRILFSQEPAVLILVDGKPALRQFEGTNLLRVINTRPLLLLDQGSGTYYLHFMDRWLQARDIEGTWAVATNPPAAVQGAVQKAQDANLPVDLLDDPDPDVKAEMESGKMPLVYVSTSPAELILTEGEPQMAPIEGTNLLWVKNTSDQLVFDVNSQDYYVLLSGRWFRTRALAKGPWEYVSSDKLPADFAKIPENHPKGDVLASVAGTPQAKESLIANAIPQTATINRKDAKLEVSYDGQPQFQPIEQTGLSYAVNSPTPVIQVDPSSYYAVENGVWFNSSAATGPWLAAASVPPAIYSIPPSNPLFYVTNVYAYGGTPDYLYYGYTPGYFGTCVAPWGGVVWGTGWAYRPWVGNRWYGRPWSYGFGTRFGWTAGGWGLGFGSAFTRPWWGPVGWNAARSASAWRAGWASGYGGRYANVHRNTINFNNFNAYNRWGNNVRVNNFRNVRVSSNRAAVVNNRVGNTNIVNRSANVGAVHVQRGLNNVYAGHDGNVYRRENNAWQARTNAGWQSVRPEQFNNVNRGLNNDFAARRAATINANHFQARGGFAGYHGGYGGYRGAAGFHGGGGFRGGRR